MNKTNRRHWTPEQDRILHKLFLEGKRDRHISGVLGKSPGAVKNRRGEKRWLKQGWKVTPIKTESIRLFEQNVGINDIATILGVKPKRIRDVLYNAGVDLHPDDDKQFIETGAWPHGLCYRCETVASTAHAHG